MNLREFNSENVDREKLVEENYQNIQLDETYDEKLYELALKGFLESDKFKSFTSEEQKSIEGFFGNLKKFMKQEQIPTKFKLPAKFYLDVFKSEISSFSSIDKEAKPNDYRSFNRTMERAVGSLNYVKNNDNKFDDKVASMLWDIYKRDDLSIGIHGTKLEENFDISPENCDFFKHGIMINERYENGDARRTVNFQDLPGKQWAFGHITFLKLMNYEYDSKNERVSSDTQKANYSCIVVRPKNMKNTAYDENCPEEFSMVTPKTHITTNDGKFLSGHLIKPEYILGIFKNNEEFVRNPKCNLEKLADLNETIGIRNEEEKKRAEMTKKLSEETKDVKAPQKKSMFGRIRSLLTKSREEIYKGDSR